MSNFTDYKHEADQAPRDHFRQYRRRSVIELRPYVPGEDTAWEDAKPGDMIARDPDNHTEQWLVPAGEFIHDYEPF